MIFQHTLEAVLAGRKTQTRRLMNQLGQAMEYCKSYPNYPHEIQSVWTAKNGVFRTKWEVYKTYAVQAGRGKPAIARIKIIRINEECIGRGVSVITDEQAKAEGFANRAEFLATWEAIHGAKMLTAPVWVLTFKLVTGD